MCVLKLFSVFSFSTQKRLTLLTSLRQRRKKRCVEVGLWGCAWVISSDACVFHWDPCSSLLDPSLDPHLAPLLCSSILFMCSEGVFGSNWELAPNTHTKFSVLPSVYWRNAHLLVSVLGCIINHRLIPGIIIVFRRHHKDSSFLLIKTNASVQLVFLILSCPSWTYIIRKHSQSLISSMFNFDEEHQH